jgi:hemerythrin
MDQKIGFITTLVEDVEEVEVEAEEGAEEAFEEVADEVKKWMITHRAHRKVQ